MARRIVGLDIGSYSIKICRIETSKRHERLKVLNVNEVVYSSDEFAKKNALLSCQKEGLLEAESIIMALPAMDCNMRHLPVPFAESRKIESILPGILDTEVPLNLSEYVSSWHLESQNSIRLGFGKKKSIQSLLSLTQPLGIDPRIINLSPAVYFELIRQFGNEAFWYQASLRQESTDKHLGLFIDFGHSSTNFVIFDDKGLILTKAILKGGEKVTEDISKALNIPFLEAQELKHNLNHLGDVENSKIITQIAQNYYNDIWQELKRLIISLKSQNKGNISVACLVGQGVSLMGAKEFFNNNLNALNCTVNNFPSLFVKEVEDEKYAQALSLSICGLHPHSKDNRFNFRKDEFVWRGGLDFLKVNASSFLLWALAICCSLTTLWFSIAFVLDKENKVVEGMLKETCNNILGQKDLNATKCLSLMKEQISANTDLGVPEYTASNVYVDLANFIPKEMNLTITELDVQDKKVRIKGETTSFEDVDKLVAQLSKIPCFVRVEKGGRVQMKAKGVDFQLTNDIDCSLKKDAIKP